MKRSTLLMTAVVATLAGAAARCSLALVGVHPVEPAEGATQVAHAGSEAPTRPPAESRERSRVVRTGEGDHADPVDEQPAREESPDATAVPATQGDQEWLAIASTAGWTPEETKRQRAIWDLLRRFNRADDAKKRVAGSTVTPLALEEVAAQGAVAREGALPDSLPVEPLRSATARINGANWDAKNALKLGKFTLFAWRVGDRFRVTVGDEVGWGVPPARHSAIMLARAAGANAPDEPRPRSDRRSLQPEQWERLLRHMGGGEHLLDVNRREVWSAIARSAELGELRPMSPNDFDVVFVAQGRASLVPRGDSSEIAELLSEEETDRSDVARQIASLLR